MQELIVIDEQVYTNPTINLIQNPTLNPYNTTWSNATQGGITASQHTGGGVTITANNAGSAGFRIFETFQGNSGGVSGVLGAPYAAIAGQTYVLSFYAQSSSASGITASIEFGWTDATSSAIGGPITYDVSPSTPTTATRYSVVMTAPAGTAYFYIELGLYVSNNTNSGSITFTNVQLEPQWFPTSISYPTPFCGPSQTNCQILPSGNWIRQYRKFAGFVNHIKYENYVGNSRDVTIDAAGYAWLCSLILCNDSFSSTYDSAMITTLVNKYITDWGSAMVATANIIKGSLFTTLQSNWDDLRTLFDNAAAQSTFYWTIDSYWSFVYAPPGYYSMQISLICDNSSTPNLTTTYPAYNFSAEMDFTQPGAVALVIGSGTNVAEVIDGSMAAVLGNTSGYVLPTASSYMRKVNESALGNINDCVQRGMAELLQYDYPRWIYHLTTNVELVPGYSIQVTSNTDNLSNTTLLIQQTTATWLGTSETMTTTWEYQSDLGAVNRAATHIMSRLFRMANSNSSAPAITNTTLAIIERLGAQESGITSGTYSTSAYPAAIMADGALAYYRLGELTGTIADDISGSGYNGTLHGTVTLNQASLITHASTDAAMKFDGSTAYISLPTGVTQTGNSTWTLEAWVKINAFPGTGANGTIVWFGTKSNQESAALKVVGVTGGNGAFVLSTYFGDIQSSNVSLNTIYHVVGTYDQSSTRLYVNGSLAAGPTAFTVNIVTNYAGIGATDAATTSEYFNGTIDEVAIYQACLSSTQVANHHTIGIS
jgi:hypothetical protein